MPAKSFDVVAIGNAIVDVLTHTDESFLESHGMVKGSMLLIDEDAAHQIYDDMGPAVEASGGSAGNTAAGIASLGGRVGFVGRIRDDQLGDVFAHDIRSIGVDYRVPAATDGPATARCFIFITGGRPAHHEHLPRGVEPAVARRRRPGLRGVRPRSSTARATSGTCPTPRPRSPRAWTRPAPPGRRWRSRCRTRSASIATGPSSSSWPSRASTSSSPTRPRSCSLYEVDTFEEAAERVAGHCEIACLTRSEKGSVIITLGRRAHRGAGPPDRGGRHHRCRRPLRRRLPVRSAPTATRSPTAPAWPRWPRPRSSATSAPVPPST